MSEGFQLKTARGTAIEMDQKIIDHMVNNLKKHYLLDKPLSMKDISEFLIQECSLPKISGFGDDGSDKKSQERKGRVYYVPKFQSLFGDYEETTDSGKTKLSNIPKSHVFVSYKLNAIKKFILGEC